MQNCCSYFSVNLHEIISLREHLSIHKEIMNFGFSLQRRSCSKIRLNEGATEAVKMVIRSPFLDESAFLSCLAEAETLLAPRLCRTCPEFGDRHDYEK